MTASELLKTQEGAIVEELRAAHFGEAQRLAVEALHGNPRIAQFWVFLGESLENLGDGTGAWAAYNRAWILDPQATWVNGVRSRLGDRGQGVCPDWLSDLLSVRERSVAAAIIARDESETIEETVTRLKGAVDRVVVVDTGSSDDTAARAQSAGAVVYRWEWNDDFSDARNFALSKVTEDWVLWVDADELLETEDAQVPRIVAGLFDVDGPVILRIVQVNAIQGRTEPNYDMSRMFPTRFGLRWWGRIHEQVGPPEVGIQAQSFPRPAVRIRVHHRGYEPSVMEKKKKLQRNIALLRRSVSEDPGDIASWGFLGRELYLRGELDEAIACFQRCEELAPLHRWYARLPETRGYHIEALSKQGRVGDALAVAVGLTKDYPDYPAGWYLRGRVELSLVLKGIENAKEFFLEAQSRASKYRGIVSSDSSIAGFKAVAGLADVAKLQGKWCEALQLYRQCEVVNPSAVEISNQVRWLNEEADRVLKTGP